MSYFKLTKVYRGGSNDTYIELPDGEEPNDDMLASIGDNTNGGQESGYAISWEKVKTLPKGQSILPRTRQITIY